MVAKIPMARRSAGPLPKLRERQEILPVRRQLFARHGSASQKIASQQITSQHCQHYPSHHRLLRCHLRPRWLQKNNNNSSNNDHDDLWSSNWRHLELDCLCFRQEQHGARMAHQFSRDRSDRPL